MIIGILCILGAMLFALWFICSRPSYEEQFPIGCAVKSRYYREVGTVVDIKHGEDDVGSFTFLVVRHKDGVEWAYSNPDLWERVEVQP